MKYLGRLAANEFKAAAKPSGRDNHAIFRRMGHRQMGVMMRNPFL